MTAPEIIAWIEGARYKSKKAGLENIRALLALLGNPQDSFPCCHIAGTNGKGSVCAFTERVLRESGLKTGLYTSPYLRSYNERIQIDGAPVSDALLVRCGERVKAAAEALLEKDIFSTAFELGTALAFLIFQEEKVDFAVLETGLGGRFDSTNVVSPVACAIASIGMDHMTVLGDTIEQIAAEKAGIIKENTPVALYPFPQDSVFSVFERACAEKHAPFLPSGNLALSDVVCDAYGASFALISPAFGKLALRIALPGRHQVQNARLAVALAGLLKEKGVPITAESLCRGIENARWAGRLEWVKPNLLLDGAHNPQGAKALVEFVKEFLPDRRITLITGMMRDKQPETCAQLFAQIADEVFTTRVAWQRAVDENELAALYPRARAFKTVEEALDAALDCDLALVCGSLYLVGDVRKMFP
ncbi:MAG: bifunctional folylpolyglutamate synthase/dihydrofolate synthase [Christensenellales bacterium]|jgi:dihydrofolate synthase/folylpolyglutamate synthase